MARKGKMGASERQRRRERRTARRRGRVEKRTAGDNDQRERKHMRDVADGEQALHDLYGRAEKHAKDERKERKKKRKKERRRAV